MERRHIKTAVVGGGAAGCSTAYQLASTDRKIVLFEQSSSLGGRSSTQRVEDLTVDTGAGFFTNYYPLLSKYIAEVGLEHEVVSLSRRAGLVRDGKICKIELGNVLSLLRFPHIGWLDKLVMLRHMFGLYLHRHSFDLVDPRILARFDNRPIAEHFRNALGDRLYEFLLRPTVEPFWYSSCETLSSALGLALHSRFSTTRFYSLSRGMDSVYRALALGTDCRLCTEVTRLRARSDGQVEVSYQTSGGRPDSCVFDEVVVATTAEKALGLTTALSDALVSVAQKDFLRTQRYTRVLHVAYIMDRLSDVADLSLLAHCGPGNGTVAAVGFHGQKYPGSKLQSQRQEIVSIYITDSDKLRVCTRDRSDLAKRCWELARELYPRFPPQSSPIDASIQDAAMPVHTVGRYKQAADFHEQQSGPIVFAGDYLATATVEGALRSGAWAADVLKRHVPGTAGAGLRTVEDVTL